MAISDYTNQFITTGVENITVKKLLSMNNSILFINLSGKVTTVPNAVINISLPESLSVRYTDLFFTYYNRTKNVVNGGRISHTSLDLYSGAKTFAPGDIFEISLTISRNFRG